MIRTVITAGLVLALGAFLLAWLEVQKATRVIAPDVYVTVVAALFAVGGIWLGWKIATRRYGPDFIRNEAAVRS
ncbi:MAG: helix-turn-helix transcriptional regulator, partial [Brevundimonas sp.]|nr:helix-turn-helix transcriptional regulator [Brevundimonas sp.]